MPVLVTGIHAFAPAKQGVDGRNKSGHDDVDMERARNTHPWTREVVSGS